MTNWTQARMIAVAAGVLAGASVVAADQIGQAAFPTPNSRVGGVRAGFPSPHFGTGRNGTLLNRTGTLLPPAPARPAPRPNVVECGSAGPVTTGSFGVASRPVADRPCLVPSRSDGFTADGNVNDDRFRLKFHLGSGVGVVGGVENCGNNVPNLCCPVNTCGTTYPWSWTWGWYDRYPRVVYSGPWYGTDPFVTQGQASANTPAAAAPAAATSAAPREPTLIERADEAWQAGRPDAAAGFLKDYLKAAPDDADAMRYLALAQIDQKKLEEGVALMAMAYDKLPQLASRPLPGSAIPGGLDAMRKRVNAVSGFANQTKGASAWLTVAVLVQSEGRLEVARKLAEKAKAAGLGEKVATELLGSLGN